MRFEKFLQNKYGRMGEHKDSDRDSDLFGEWLLRLDPAEWIGLAEEWAIGIEGLRITQDDKR